MLRSLRLSVPFCHKWSFIQFHFKPGMTFQNLAGLDANDEFPTDISEL